MPLLSLPVELLHEIILKALAPPTSMTTSCCDDFRPTLLFSHPTTTSLAHTCQLLRSLTLPFMYASLTVLPELTTALHTLLASDDQIAGYVRQLTLFTTDARGAQLLHGILKHCKRLQDLRLDGSHATEEFTAPLLAHVHPQPLTALGLRRLHWNQISQYLSSAPRELHTVRLEDPIGGSPTADRISQHLPEAHGLHSTNSNPTAPVASPSLPGVHSLICNMGDSTSTDSGKWLAQMMQNIQVLDMHFSDSTLSMLKCYVKLGTRLTELTVHMRETREGLCGTVAVLAPSLRRFVAHGGVVCHLLFDADWAFVEDLEVVCRGVCDDVQLGVMREALVRLITVRPSARVLVNIDEWDQVRWNERVGNVASIDEFDELKEWYTNGFFM